MRSACPDDLPSTPAGRMAAMRQRLEAMREAVQIVRPALDKFYTSLSDEQKARFDALEPEQAPATDKTAKAELSQVCSTAVTKTNAAPTARIQETLRLTPEQRTALDNLDRASAQAAEMLAANCPTDETLTPPGRLAAMEAPPRRDAEGARRGAAGAGRLLRLADRRAEGALQPARRAPAGQPLTITTPTNA